MKLLPAEFLVKFDLLIPKERWIIIMGVPSSKITLPNHKISHEISIFFSLLHDIE